MDCPECSVQFDAVARLPRILTVCGHTLCQLCAQVLLSSGGLQCPQCSKLTKAASVDTLPVNFALVQLRGREGNEDACTKHGKQLEAYCCTDKAVVCVACILEDDHKKHDVIAIQKAASKERDRLASVMSTAQQTEQALVRLENDIRILTETLQNDYERCREEFEVMFDQMKSIIIEREAVVMEKLKSTLETEVGNNRQREFQSKKHMYLVQTLKNEIAKVAHEADLQVLRKTQDREAVIKAAFAKLPTLPTTRPFGQYNKEVELNGLWKLVKPLAAKQVRSPGPATPVPMKKTTTQPLALSTANFTKELRKQQTKPLDASQSFIDSKPSDRTKRAQTLKVTIQHNDSPTKRPEPRRQPVSEDSVPAAPKTWAESEFTSSNISLDLASLCQPPPAFVYVVGGFSDSGLVSVERYDCVKDEWTFVCSSLTNRTQFGSVILSGKVVALGGKTVTHTQAGKRVCGSEEYDIGEDFWKPGSIDLPAPRSGFACVAIADDLYVVGGTDGVPLKKMELWSGSEWTALSNMRQRRDELAAVLGPDLQIYAIGGYGGTDMYPSLRTCQRTTECFSIAENCWVQVAAMNTPRRALAAVALPDGIYAIGGYDGTKYLNSVEKLDIVRGVWVELAPMKYARCTLSAVSSPDCQFIYAIGGFNGTALRVVERYSIVEDTWTEVAQMHDPRFMHSCVIVSPP